MAWLPTTSTSPLFTIAAAARIKCSSWSRRTDHLPSPPHELLALVLGDDSGEGRVLPQLSAFLVLSAQDVDYRIQRAIKESLPLIKPVIRGPIRVRLPHHAEVLAGFREHCLRVSLEKLGGAAPE
jgi:hypothetical protein